MALGNNYITINGAAIPNPRSFKISYNTIETTKMTEAGTDVVLPARFNKKTIDMTFQVTSRWKTILRGYTETPTVTMSAAGETMIGRLRFKDNTLKQGSEFIQDSDGLWTATLQFFEI